MISGAITAQPNEDIAMPKTDKPMTAANIKKQQMREMGKSPGGSMPMAKPYATKSRQKPDKPMSRGMKGSMY